jgi:peroxiredoxin Q/BCP
MKISTQLLTLLAAISILGVPAMTVRADSPKVGDKAPGFEGTDQNGKAWKAGDFLGKKVLLLYFYPKDDTPGCTKEACGLRDRMSDLKKDNVEVVGVSFDSADSHKAFIAKHNLNFSLLADTSGKISDTFGVRNPGRNMARRVSFLIGLDGKIAHVTDNPSADVHLAEMEKAILSLKK